MIKFLKTILKDVFITDYSVESKRLRLFLILCQLAGCGVLIFFTYNFPNRWFEILDIIVIIYLIGLIAGPPGVDLKNDVKGSKGDENYRIEEEY